MANKKFTELTALTGANALDTDIIPIVDLSEADATKNKKITVAELKKQGTVFSDLPGTAWDGSYKTKTLTSNTALTFSSTKRSGVLIVTQDATGSRTLSINGTSVTINTAANSRTIITFLFDDVLTDYIFAVETNIVGVTGGGGDVTAPTLVSATIENGDPNIITLTYSEALNSSSTPATGDFAVVKNGGAAALVGVNVTGSTVLLELVISAISTDVFTLSYTPGTNKIEDAAGNDAAALTTEAVDNNVVGTLPGFLAMTPEGGVTESPTGTFTKASGVGRATSVDTLPTSGNGYIMAKYNSSTDAGTYISLDNDGTIADYTDMLYGFGGSGGTWRYIAGGSAPVDTGVAIVTGHYFRLVRSGGNTVKAETSADGFTWTTRHTFATTSTAELWGKFLISPATGTATEVRGDSFS